MYLGPARLQTHPQAQTYLPSGHCRHGTGSGKPQCHPLLVGYSTALHPLPSASSLPCAHCDLCRGAPWFNTITSLAILCLQTIPRCFWPFPRSQLLAGDSLLGVGVHHSGQPSESTSPHQHQPGLLTIKAMENFTSLRIPESWWWQGLAEVFTSASWASLQDTTDDQHLHNIPSKLTSFPRFRAMYLTATRSAQVSREKGHLQQARTPSTPPIPLAALKLKQLWQRRSSLSFLPRGATQDCSFPLTSSPDLSTWPRQHH